MPSRDKMRAKDYDGAVIDIIQNISNQDYDLALMQPVVERNSFYEVPKSHMELVVEILDHFWCNFS